MVLVFQTIASMLTTNSDDVSTTPRFFWSDVVLIGLGVSTAILTALTPAVVALRFHVSLPVNA